jgi:CxxC-x17-CxxC domain-containing protein
MKKTTKVKKLTNALKRFVTPTAELDDEPELAETMLKLVERLEALERKTDLMMGQMSNLSVEVRKMIQQFPRPNSFQSVPPQHSSSPQPTPQLTQRPHGVQNKPLPRQRPPLSQLTPLTHSSPVVSQTAEVSNNSVQGPGRARRDRLLHKAICADCSKDCEVPITPTEGRPVYCKACYILRKSAKTLPVKSADRIDAVGTMQKMTGRVPSPPHVAPQATPGASPAPMADASMMRSSGHVPPQIHNLARSNAVAYMAKKAGHLASPQAARPQQSAAVGPSTRVSAAKSTSRPRPVHSERPKPKKRTR